MRERPAWTADVERSNDYIPSSLRCNACGYDLRGLDPARECPECGIPVEATTLGPLMKETARRSTKRAKPPPAVRMAVRVLIVAALVVMGVVAVIAIVLSRPGR